MNWLVMDSGNGLALNIINVDQLDLKEQTSVKFEHKYKTYSSKISFKNVDLQTPLHWKTRTIKL